MTNEMTNYEYKLFEDNAGQWHIAVSEGAECLYYHVGSKACALDTLGAILEDDCPPLEDWDGGEENPGECLAEIEEVVAARNGGAWLRMEREVY